MRTFGFENVKTKVLGAALAASFFGNALAANAIQPGEASYDDLPGCAKAAFLFDERIEPSEYQENPSFNLRGGFQALLGAGASFSLGKSFDHASDEMPAGRIKFLHPFGSVVRVEYRADPSSPYTGMFATPSACGLARLSLAGPPALLGNVPGMAVKLFVDGKPSVNLHVMPSLNGQGKNQNFFAFPFSNSLPEPRGLLFQTLKFWFGLFVDNPLRLGLDHLAAEGADGARVSSPRSPYEIQFIAPEGVFIPTDTARDLRDELAQIPAGVVLFEVFARPAPGARLERIGELLTSSRFVASSYGDETLFFQHQASTQN